MFSLSEKKKKTASECETRILIFKYSDMVGLFQYPPHNFTRGPPNRVARNATAPYLRALAHLLWLRCICIF